MALKLHMHPLASYCHKALIAFYERDVPFEACFLNLGDAQARADFLARWPMGKMPLLEDEARGVLLPESSIIIEYLDRHYPGPRMIPQDADLGLEVRLQDRFFDQYVHAPMQAITGDLLREDARDPFGVEQAKDRLRGAYDMIETRMAGRTWMVGETFTLADCSAAPALFYANGRVPFGPGRPHAAAYLERLKQRPSYARALKEAEPYFHMVPQ
jgi:glutathione S-transferase